MATSKSDLIAGAAAFRDALMGLAQNGAFTDAEKSNFQKLADFYQDRLAAFQSSPRYGDASDYYENPLAIANTGTASTKNCKSGDNASQQPTYDAANSGGDALDSVTTSSSAFALSGLKGSLLVSDLAQTTAPSRLFPNRASVTMRRNSTLSMLAFAPPTSPPAAGAPAPPTGPTPPAKTTTADPPWLAKLMTMFPAEAVTAYVAGQQYFDGGALWLVGVTLLAVMVVRYFAMMSPDGKANWLPVWVAAGSFILWVGATADKSLATELWNYFHLFKNADDLQHHLTKGTGFAIILWTWVLPAIVKLNPTPPDK